VGRVVGGAFDEVVVGGMGEAERRAYLGALEEAGSPKGALLRSRFKDMSIADDLAEEMEIKGTAPKAEQRLNTAVSKMEDVDMEDAL